MTELLVRDVLHDFHELQPEKFVNVTNGVTPRRWMALANPELAQLLDARIGTDWAHDAQGELVRLERFAEDAWFAPEEMRIELAPGQLSDELLASGAWGPAQSSDDLVRRKEAEAEVLAEPRSARLVRRKVACCRIVRGSGPCPRVQSPQGSLLSGNDWR